MNQRPIAMRLLLCAFLFMVAGCSAEGGEGRGGKAAEVGFVVVTSTEVPLPVTLGGRTVAYETSEVRPQINGLIRRRLFTEGSYVRAGQPLYEIDASLYRAAVNQAQANLSSASASAEAALALANRYRPLAEMQAIAEQDYTDALAQSRVAQAGVAQNNAALETARINLRYATITAPISGRIGRSLSTVGALVSASQADPLAIIQRFDPIYVDIQQSSAQLTALRQSVASGEVLAGSTTVRLNLEDGSAYGYTGRVQFSDISVGESTGSVVLRASFPNPDGILLPGMFVKAVFDQAIQPNAFLVPQPGVQRDFDGSAFVYIVGPDNKALRRKVVADRTLGTNWVVTSGLRNGDRLIVQGLANVQQDSPIRPVPATTPQQIGPPANAGAAGGGAQGGAQAARPGRPG